MTGLISLLYKGLSRVFSNTTVQRHQLFGTQTSYGLTLTSIHNYWKDHSFDYMGLFLNTKSNKCLLGWPPQISSSMGQPHIYRPPIPSSVSPSLKETQLITHIPFLVNLKLRMKNHHAGNCALGDKEVCELLLLNTLKLS